LTATISLAQQALAQNVTNGGIVEEEEEGDAAGNATDTNG
jgi:hypothetical protein